MELRAALDEIFSEDLADGATIQAESVRGNSRKFRAENMLKDDYDKYWAVDDDVRKVSFVVTLPDERTFNRVQLQEYIPLGQRVSSFSIDALSKDGSWVQVAHETTIGYKRIVHIPVTTTTAVRVNIEEAEACPVLNGFALFMDNIYVSDEKSNVASGIVKTAIEHLVVELDDISPVKGFVYAPKENGEGGCIVTYRLEVTSDGKSWETIFEEKMFDNIINNPMPQEVLFGQPVQARALRLIPLRVEGAQNVTYGVSDFRVIL